MYGKILNVHKRCIDNLPKLKLSTIDSDYIGHYFESSKWYKGVSEIAVEGARNHGLLNIGVEDFFETSHFVPTLDEQREIASLLTLIDERIATQNFNCLTRKNSNNESNLVHFLMQKGDFAYNKSYSGDYTWGTIKSTEQRQFLLQKMFI